MHGPSGEPVGEDTSKEIPKQDEESGGSLKCPICSKVFTKIFMLNIHLSKHQVALCII